MINRENYLPFILSRRVNPLKDGDVYTLLDGVRGKGHYAGAYMAWQVNNNGWWGEGEIKFHLDGDTDPTLSGGKGVAGSTGFPTICGTGTEDYFCGSYTGTRPRRRPPSRPCPPPMRWKFSEAPAPGTEGAALSHRWTRSQPQGTDNNSLDLPG